MRAGAAQALQRLRGRDALRLARGQPAAHHRRRHAQQRVDDGRAGIEAQRRCDTGEIAAAEISRQHAQRERREGRAEHDAEHAARDAEQRRLGQHEAEPLAPREAEHAEQRELLLPLRDRQREDGEDEKRAGEQGHQREHREVHAVGMRHARCALRAFVGRGGAHAVGQRELAQHRVARGACL